MNIRLRVAKQSASGTTSWDSRDCRLGFEGEFEEVVEMSSHDSEPLLERWWPLLVITFGLIFLSILVGFKPSW
jgi:hypothetical protein